MYLFIGSRLKEAFFYVLILEVCNLQCVFVIYSDLNACRNVKDTAN